MSLLKIAFEAMMRFITVAIFLSLAVGFLVAPQETYDRVKRMVG
jgi:hypothetical protein